MVQTVNRDSEDFSLAGWGQGEVADPRIKKLYDYLSLEGQKAYRHECLLSNAVFSKSELSLVALNEYFDGKRAGGAPFLFLLKKILRYFAKSFGWMVIFCVQSFAYRLSQRKFSPDPTKPLTLIDIYLDPEQIIEAGALTDRFFPGLEDRLKSKDASYAYVPKFGGSNHPLLYYRMFCLLKEQSRPILPCFQLLSVCDYLKMFAFIPVYLFRLFQQIARLGTSAEDELLRFFLWDTMDHTAVKNYARLLFGRCISKVNVPAIKCISWYENQSQDKNFYKGLRFISGKVRIFGAQLYHRPGGLCIPELNLHIDEKEAEHGLTPDCILVNGTYYLRKESSLDFKLGPSMRYAKLFQTKVDARGKTALLVLMPYFEYEIDKILEIIDEVELPVEIFLKFHPATDRKKYATRLQGKMQMVEGDLYALFSRVGCVMGKATGALAEAACLGIPVINIKTGLGQGHDYMPHYGKGVIWENASSGIEILEWVNKFQVSLLTEMEKIRSIADKYKKTLFCEPTNKKIDEAFELDEQMRH